jgi:hypothetical protein
MKYDLKGVDSRTRPPLIDSHFKGLRQLVVMLEIKIVKKALSVLQKNNSEESGKCIQGQETLYKSINTNV